MYACLHQSGGPDATGIMELARAFSPAIEISGERTVLFSIAGLGRLMGSLDQIASEIARRGAERDIVANLAIAANPDTALLAATHLPGVTLIPPGKEAECLGRLRLEQLPMADGLRETLARWGLKTLADLAELPPIGLAERLGEEGVQLYNLALGRLQRPLNLEPPAASFTERLDLEDPVSNLEPLLFLLARLTNVLCRRLQAHNRATNRITAKLGLEGGGEHERTLELPVPQKEGNPLLKLLQLDLEAHPPPAAVTGITLRFHPVKPRQCQGGLFLPPTPAPDKLHLTLARIAGIVGQNNVGAPALLDTHRPDAHEIHPFKMGTTRVMRSERISPMGMKTPAGNVGAGLAPPATRRSQRTRAPQATLLHAVGVARKPASPGQPKVHAVLRFYRPPLAARVRLRESVPRKVLASRVAGDVVDAAGPWRTSGGWWRQTVWTRDEWDLALTDGGVYRVFCELRSHGWFVEGVYD